ncbi:hypothetical protein HanPI659440_Chr00c13g0726801 [Helianthus annuus]|nr:hypothetical protein HanPI659440_Chr00c13g0726801 [Helianthus annuus]
MTVGVFFKGRVRRSLHELPTIIATCHFMAIRHQAQIKVLPNLGGSFGFQNHDHFIVACQFIVHHPWLCKRPTASLYCFVC